MDSPRQTETSPAPELPLYPGIRMNNILLVQTEADAQQAYTEMHQATTLGFDTESKPVFAKGQRSDGPHLIQLATESRAYLFAVTPTMNAEVVHSILENPQILKVGFGLGDDVRRLRAKLGVEMANVLDLGRAMRESKHRDMGAKAAVAKFFGMYLQKSKKTSTSNWAAAQLSERQILYAANDAQVALLVYLRWRSINAT